MPPPFGVHINLTVGSPAPVYPDFSSAPLKVCAVYFTDAQMNSLGLTTFRDPYKIGDIGSNKGRSKVIPGIDGSVTVSSGSIVLAFPLTDAQFNDPKPGLFIYCEPLGAAALRCTAIDKYKRGLLYEVRDLKKFKSTSPTYNQAFVLNVEVFKSVVSHTVDRMQGFTHGNYSPIDEIRNMEDREAATARLGALAVGDVAPWKAQAGDIILSGRKNNYDYTYATNNPDKAGILDLKPDIGTIDKQYQGLTPYKASQDYGDVVTIGNNGRLYSRDVFSNLNWGYVGNYAGFQADELNRLANLDPTSTAVPQDDLSTIRGHQIAKDADDKMEGKGANVCLAPRPVIFRHLVSILDTDDRFTRPWDIENEGKKGYFVDSPGALRNLLEQNVGPLK